MDANPRKFFMAHRDGEVIGMLHLMVFERMPKPGKEASRWVYLGNAYARLGFEAATELSVLRL